MSKSLILTTLALAFISNMNAAPPVKDPMSVQEAVLLSNGSLPKISSTDFLNLLKKRYAELKIIEDIVKNQIKNGEDPFNSPVKEYITAINSIDAKLKKIQKEYPSAEQIDKDLMVISITEILKEIKSLENKILNIQAKSKL